MYNGVCEVFEWPTARFLQHLIVHNDGLIEQKVVLLGCLVMMVNYATRVWEVPEEQSMIKDVALEQNLVDRYSTYWVTSVGERLQLPTQPFSTLLKEYKQPGTIQFSPNVLWLYWAEGSSGSQDTNGDDAQAISLYKTYSLYWRRYNGNNLTVGFIPNWGDEVSKWSIERVIATFNDLGKVLEMQGRTTLLIV